MTLLKKHRIIYSLLLISSFQFTQSISANEKTKNFELEAFENQILHLGNGSEPRELDPATSSGVPASRILDNIFEGLTALDPVTLDPIPAVAESWTISEDGKIYTFKIRKNSSWSDGTPLKANDFVKSWVRVLNPKTASEYAYQLYYIKNGEDYNKGKLKDTSKLGVKAKDPYTLIVTLEHATAYFLRLAAFHTLYPTPAHVIAKYPDKKWTREEYLVSNGPFKLKEWKLNNYIKLIPNEHYWDKSQNKLKEVFLYPIENQDTEEKSFLAGELTQTYEVPILKVPTYLKQKSRNKNKYHPYQSDPYLASYFYRFNTSKKPFNDVKVRKALSMVIDRNLLVSRVTRRGEIAATSFTPPNVSGYTYKGPALWKRSLSKETLAKAKKLLSDAGYPNGKDFPKVELLYNTSENHKKIALVIQQMWKKHLNINIGIFNQEWKVYLNNQKKLNFHISRAGWVGDYPDPNTFLDMFITDGGQNNTAWSNKEYDKLIEQAAQSLNQAERYSYFQKAEAILMEELPILPLYIYTRSRLTSQKLKIMDNKGKISDWFSNISDRSFLKYFVLVK